MSSRRFQLRVAREVDCPLYRVGDHLVFDLPGVDAASSTAVCAFTVAAVLKQVVPGDRCAMQAPPGLLHFDCPREKDPVRFEVELLPEEFEPEPTEDMLVDDLPAAVAHLRSVPIFRVLPAPFLADLAQRIRVERYVDGDVILQRGHPGQAFYVVREGTLEVIGFAEDQVASVVSRLRERDCFGEMSILTGAPVAATVVARGPVTLYALEKSDFEQILGENPFMAARFTRLLASRLLAANYLLAKETQKTFAGKLATMNFAAVLQALSDSQRSGTLRLKHPAGAEAELGFAGGRIFTARLGELSGEEAVYALCAWNAGEFALEPTPVPTVDQIQVGVINLLLEGMRRLDEAELVSAVPLGGPG
jgi:CRP-like cAMP-binding protein